MDPDPRRVIGEELCIHEVAQMFLETWYRRLVVVRDGCVTGQVSRQNVLLTAQPVIQALSRVRAASGHAWTVGAFMDKAAQTVDESTGLLRIANYFRESDQRRFPVLQGSRLAGQITRKNLLMAANEVLNRPPTKQIGRAHV